MRNGRLIWPPQILRQLLAKLTMYEQQATPLDENLSSNPDEAIQVTSQLVTYWKELPLWAKILAITNFISGGTQLISMFWIIPKLRMMMYFSPIDANNYLVLFIILYLISITFTLLIGWQLWRYAIHLQTAVLHSDNEELEFSYYYQYRYFKTLGWMLISLIAIFFIAIFVVIYAAGRY